jgi:hypothetical protein
MEQVKVMCLIMFSLGSCTQAITVLDGATHAKGSAHIEGYFSDTEADVELCKVPTEYSVEQAIAYCGEE